MDKVYKQGPRALKRFSQNFLHDAGALAKIARVSGAREGDLVLEVGPGMGTLTRHLLKTGTRVHAVEIDKRFEPELLALQEEWGPQRLIVSFADAQDVDEQEIFSGLEPARCRIVSNLPYHLSSALLVKWFSLCPLPFTSVTLLLQKEMAQRLAAAPGTKSYGRLSVLAQVMARASLVGIVKRELFRPVPAVDSAIVHFQMREKTPPAHVLETMGKITQSAFSQRRKMLRRSLSSWDLDLSSFGLEDTQRAENVEPEQFLAVARSLTAGEDR